MALTRWERRHLAGSWAKPTKESVRSARQARAGAAAAAPEATPQPREERLIWQVARYAAARYRSPDQQSLGALFLDVNCRLPGRPAPHRHEIFRGLLTAAAVEPGVVFWRALAASAAFVIVFQTRANGDPAPRGADWAFTRRLVEASEILGIALRDHLIVASAEQWLSLHRRHPWCDGRGWRRPSSEVVAGSRA